MKRFACLLGAMLALSLLVDEASAFGRKKQQVTEINVNGAGLPQQINVQTKKGLFGRKQQLTQININAPRGVALHGGVGYNNAYVNSQLLVNPNFRRAQIVDVNSFTYAPLNTPANLRFQSQGVTYLRQPVITQTPIIEQVTEQQPATVIQTPQGTVNNTGVNYQTLPQQPQQVQQLVQQVQQPAQYQQMELLQQQTTSYGTCNLPQRALLSQTPGCQQPQRLSLPQHQCQHPARLSARFHNRNYAQQPVALAPSRLDIRHTQRGLLGRRGRTSVHYH